MTLTPTWRRCIVSFACAAFLAACTDQEPFAPKTAPSTASATNNSGGAGNYFFIAWATGDPYSSYPIQTQNGLRDGNEFRQYVGDWYPDAATLSFAASNPGHLYINGDEPDQSCIAPYDYAGTYHDFVSAIRGADPTAQVSPAGFAEPNNVCCPTPPGSCYTDMHSTGYAAQFYSAYEQRYGVAPPVNEWRFHDFGLDQQGNVAGWYSRVSSEAAWSVSHGANMVLGSWGFLDWDAADGWNQPLSVFLDDMKQAMALVLNDTRINQAVWWSYKNTGYSHYLANSDGSLTSEGSVYSNIIPADIATGVTTVGASGAQAKAQWTNTTTDWGVEVEFWEKPSGSSTFVLESNDFVAPGGTQTPYDTFDIGAQVKSRVRYYNRLGSGPWSAFSSAILLH